MKFYIPITSSIAYATLLTLSGEQSKCKNIRVDHFQEKVTNPVIGYEMRNMIQRVLTRLKEFALLSFNQVKKIDKHSKISDK